MLGLFLFVVVGSGEFLYSTYVVSFVILSCVCAFVCNFGSELLKNCVCINVRIDVFAHRRT